MPDTVLVLNAGSSSLKWDLFAAPRARFAAVRGRGANRRTRRSVRPRRRPSVGSLNELSDRRPPRSWGTGSCTAGGSSPGRRCWTRTRVAKIESLVPLAPAAQPAGAGGHRRGRRTAARRAAGGGVSIRRFIKPCPRPPPRYALPAWCGTDYGVRRYGFHGTSHQYVSRAAAEFLHRENGRDRGKPNLVTLHPRQRVQRRGGRGRRVRRHQHGPDAVGGPRDGHPQRRPWTRRRSCICSGRRGCPRGRSTRCSTSSPA